MDPRGWGILLLLLSLVLSRGPTNIAADMDEPSNALMGAHGYCTQELVNLIVAGGCRVRHLPIIALTIIALTIIALTMARVTIDLRT
jgi:hypothetical protein